MTTCRSILLAGVAGAGLLVAAPALAQNPARLSLAEAEARAVQNHPRIRAGEEAARAAGETVREVKSAYFPTVVGSVTGADAEAGTRIAAGGLNNPIILDRLATGFAASQLLTDFGRTGRLATSATLLESSAQQDVATRRASVVLQVDLAYFEGLRARAVLRVAQETVSSRQQVVDQATALASAGLKSTLDASFAKVNLSDAQLLLVQAANDVQASDASLAEALGEPAAAAYDLADEPLPAAPPSDSAELIRQALRDRPDLLRGRLQQQSDTAFAGAERALRFPTFSLIGAAGVTPYHQAGLTDHYSAVGLNFTVPLANGGLFSARAAQATFRAKQTEAEVQDLEHRVARDVQTAWLEARTAFQRLDLTEQLLTQATDTLDLAQQRYTLGLSSIVELTQAQLGLTRAQIARAEARYAYQDRDVAVRFQIGAIK